MKKNELQNLTPKYKNIIKKIYLGKEVNRLELLDFSHYSTSTLYRTITEMSDLGLVEFSDNSPYKRGELLSLKASIGYVFAIHLSRTSFRSVFIDFKRQFFHDTQHLLKKQTTIDDVVGTLFCDYKEGLSKLGLAEDDILGIGLSSVGPIDYVNGVLLDPVFFASDKDWKNIPIKQMLESVLNLPVLIECNANSCVTGMYYSNFYKNYSSIVYFTISEAIGSGLIVNSSLLPRHHVILDGLAHMTVELNGPLCNCGNYGCVEAYVGIPALLQACKRQLKINRRASIKDVDNISFETLCELVGVQDETVILQIQNAANIFVRGVENYLKIVNTEALVLGGKIIEELPLFYELVEKKLKQDNKNIQLFSWMNESTTILNGVAEIFILSLLS